MDKNLEEVKKLHLEKYKKFPVGTEVCEIGHWPYSCAHPDCWLPPWKGYVLSEYDPIAWHGTLAFPGSADCSSVEAHVIKNMELEAKERNPFGDDDRVPLLMFYTDDIENPKRCLTSIRWTSVSKLVPYKIGLQMFKIEKKLEKHRRAKLSKIKQGEKGTKK